MRFNYAGDTWEVDLLDDGTLDTVISLALVSGGEFTAMDGDAGPAQTFTFSQEFAASYRNHKNGEMSKAGLIELGKEAAEQFEGE